MEITAAYLITEISKCAAAAVYNAREQSHYYAAHELGRIMALIGIFGMLVKDNAKLSPFYDRALDLSYYLWNAMRELRGTPA